ncbi:MAG: hypothetical protein QCI82_11905 [Candidatus Thermoplasmatota archaeon]|nr:hypothetical protein [Candidatus Thermoplasmatota archaeon]
MTPANSEEAFDSPFAIQRCLDSLKYDPDIEARSPRIVIEEGKAHCFEGALLAASALRRLGHPPLLVDLRAVNDDDHVIAVFRENGLWGAIAKSNFTTLRYRDPAYRTIRELAMSYFDLYFNTKGEKTLRSYSRPLDLSIFDGIDWERTDSELSVIGKRLDAIRHYPLIDDDLALRLSIVPDYMLEAGMLGSNPEGLYEPE